MEDRLDGLVARLEALEDVPVAEHPAVLDEVHAALVAELETLAGAARAAVADGSRQRR